MSAVSSSQCPTSPRMYCIIVCKLSSSVQIFYLKKLIKMLINSYKHNQQLNYTYHMSLYFSCVCTVKEFQTYLDQGLWEWIQWSWNRKTPQQTFCWKSKDALHLLLPKPLPNGHLQSEKKTQKHVRWPHSLYTMSYKPSANLWWQCVLLTE